MYCGKCGNEIADGLLFCTQCGAPVEPEERDDVEPALEDLQATPEESGRQVHMTSKRRSVNGKIVLLAIAGVSAVTCLLLLILNFGRISAWATRLFADPQSLMVSAYTEVVGSGVEKASARAAKAQQQESGTEIRLHIRPGDTLLELASYLISGTQSQAQWLSDIGLTVQTGTDSGNMQARAALSLVDRELVSGVWSLDENTGENWAYLPELHEKAVYLGTLQDYPSSVPAENTLSVLAENGDACRTVAERYVKLFLEGFQSVTKERQTVQVCGIQQKVTVLKAYMTQDDMIVALTGILKQMKTDEELRTLIYALSSEGADAYDAFINEIDLALSELKNMSGETEVGNALYLDTYLNAYNQIVGIGMDISEQGQTERVVHILTALEESCLGISADVLDMHFEGMLEIGAQCSGSFALSYEGDKLMDICVSDAAFREEEIAGTVTWTPTEEMTDELLGGFSLGGILDFSEVSVVTTVKSSAQVAELQISLRYGKKSLLDVDISTGYVQMEPWTIPENCVDATDEDALTDWMSQWDVDGLITKLIDVGLPENLFSEYLNG